MYYELTETQKSAKELAARFARERLLPITKDDYEKGMTRRELVEEMGELGFFGCLVPEDYGGTGSGYLTGVVIAEEIARINASYTGYFMTQMAGPPVTILKYGTKEQKERYVPEIVSGKLITLFAATEPDAGSDVASMRSTAIKKGDRYILNGAKNWITNATVADIGLVWVYTDREKRHRGISCFILDIKNTPGLSTRETEKLGLRCSKVGELVMEDVEVPEENMLGKPGQGFEILMFTLGNTRLFAAARALGVTRACLEESLEYAKSRVQFGKPIAEFQMVQEQLVDMFVGYEAAKLLVYQAARNKDRGLNDLSEVAMAKYFACEAGVKAALTAMKVFSSYGFSLEYPIQMYVRDAMAFPITEGTSNIQKMIMARTLLKGAKL